jgi:glycosyltransferase involved in cell wall biosynthesis
MKKLSVIFITRKWPPAVGGMETYSYQLAKELDKYCDLSEITLPGKPDGTPPSLFSLILFTIKSVFNVAFGKTVNIIHIGDLVLWPIAVVAHIFHPSTKIAITAYGLDIVYGTRTGLLPSIYRIYLSIGIKLCANYLNVIAISNSTANLCRSKGFRKLYTVTLGTTEPAIITPQDCKASDFVLFVGRLVKRKGAGWFINNVLPKLDAKITLKIAGKKWDPEEWAIITRSPRVQYLGVVSDEDLLSLRRKAITVLMPNITTSGNDIEGFGLTALEAASDGGILLASGIEGIVDAVIDGKTGYLLPAEDPDAWASKISSIQRWSKTERYTFITNAHKLIKKLFSWEKVALNTLEVYDRISNQGAK